MTSPKPFTCTAETPWAPGKESPGQRIAHADVEEVGEQDNGWPGGDIVTMRCRNCGHSWRAELPQ